MPPLMGADTGAPAFSAGSSTPDSALVASQGHFLELRDSDFKQMLSTWKWLK